MQHDVETVLSQSSRGELWVCVWGLAPGGGRDGATAPSVIQRKHHRITRQAGWEGGEREERKHMKGG